MKSNKDKNQSGVIHHLTLFFIVGIVLVGIGFVGFRVWKNMKDIQAAGPILRIPSGLKAGQSSASSIRVGSVGKYRYCLNARTSSGTGSVAVSLHGISYVSTSISSTSKEVCSPPVVVNNTSTVIQAKVTVIGTYNQSINDSIKSVRIDQAAVSRAP